jgi:hypothetical protein
MTSSTQVGRRQTRRRRADAESTMPPIVSRTTDPTTADRTSLQAGGVWASDHHGVVADLVVPTRST